MRLSILKADVVAILLFLFSSLTGQGTFPDLVENAYGLDQNLVNGIQYSNRHLRTQGHPYFLEDRFENGDLTIEGSIYRDVQIKYNLLSQHVEISYENLSGGNNQLITVSERLPVFRLGTNEFRLLSINEEPEKYFQVINTKYFICYVHWEKALVSLNDNIAYGHRFTYPRLLYWLELDGETEAFHNRKSFIQLFPLNMQKEIKTLLRKLPFSFNDDSPEKIIRTMNEVAQLFDSEVQP